MWSTFTVCYTKAHGLQGLFDRLPRQQLQTKTKKGKFCKKNKQKKFILLTLCENNDNNNNNFFRLQKHKVDMLSINQIDFNNSEKTKKNIYIQYIYS